MPTPLPAQRARHQQETFDETQFKVRTRDESFRSFDRTRIERAIAKALAASEKMELPTPPIVDSARDLTESVCDGLFAHRQIGQVIWLEDIQDQVELALMRGGRYEAARLFVQYRERQRRERELQIDAPYGDMEVVMEDPLLEENDDRFVLFPIEHDDLWGAFKEHLSLMWTAEEIDLSKDRYDWEQLNDDERHFLSHVLAFFAASDGIVNENLAARFYHEISSAEARSYYTMQMLIETIHSETYSLLIDTYITDTNERNRLLQAIQHIDIVAEKASWAKRWLASDCSLAERMVAFACIEGIFFSSSFCSIYWLKDAKTGKLPGLCFSNELIARDEGLHTDFAVMLHGKLQDKCSPDRIREIVCEAVEIECRFASDALPVSLLGMNSNLMSQYIQFVADRMLSQFGLKKEYHVDCPFAFMERIALQNKTNFHEKKVAEYRRAGVGTPISEQTISFNAEF